MDVFKDRRYSQNLDLDCVYNTVCVPGAVARLLL